MITFLPAFKEICQEQKTLEKNVMKCKSKEFVFISCCKTIIVDFHHHTTVVQRLDISSVFVRPGTPGH